MQSRMVAEAIGGRRSIVERQEPAQERQFAVAEAGDVYDRFLLVHMIAGPVGGPSSDMQRYEG